MTVITPYPPCRALLRQDPARQASMALLLSRSNRRAGATAGGRRTVLIAATPRPECRPHRQNLI
jgi:hypothetical protein